MRFTKYTIIAILSILVMVSATATTSLITVDQSNNFEFENDEVIIKVVGNGNVPRYTVTLLDADDSYILSFSSIFTAEDNDGDGIYDPKIDSNVGTNNGGFSKSLSSSIWTFSEVSNRSDGGAEFDITSVSLGSSASANYQNAEVQLANRIAGSDATEIKFDVILNGFDFSDAPEDTMLVFVYSITEKGGNDASEQEGNQVNVGSNGYFSSVPTATDDNGQLDVGMSSRSEDAGAKVYISYPAFSGELVHDPTMGVQASSSDNDDDANGPQLADEGGIPFSFGFGLSALAVLPIIFKKKD